MARFKIRFFLPELSKGVTAVENSLPATVAELENDPQSWPTCESEIENLEYEANQLKFALQRAKNKNPARAAAGL